MREQGERWKLDVGNPKVGLGALENHLETDASPGVRHVAVTAPNPLRARDMDMDR